MFLVLSKQIPYDFKKGGCFKLTYIFKNGNNTDGKEKIQAGFELLNFYKFFNSDLSLLRVYGNFGNFDG